MKELYKAARVRVSYTESMKERSREIRRVGMQALKDALDPIGMVRFMQQYDLGYGDYTMEEKHSKEKQSEPDTGFDEIDALLKV